MSKPVERPDPNAAIERIRQDVDACSRLNWHTAIVAAADLRVLLDLLAAREPVASVEGTVDWFWGERVTVEVYGDPPVFTRWPGAKLGQRVRVEVHAIEPAGGKQP